MVNAGVKARPSAARWRFVVIMAAHCLGAMNLLAILASSPLIREDFDLSAVEVGLLASMYSVVLGGFSLPAGRLCDRIGVKNSLLFAITVLATGAFVVALSASLMHVLIGVGLCGAGYSLVNPAAGRAILLWYPTEWRGTLMGLKQTGVPVGGAVGAGIAVFGPVIGWNWVVAATGLITLLVGIGFLTLPRDRLVARDDAIDSWRELERIGALLGEPQLARINTASGLTNGGQFILWTYLTEFLRHSAQLGVPIANACLSLLQVSSIAGRIFWGWLSDRFLHGDHRLALISLNLIAAAGLSGMILVTPSMGLLMAPLLAVILGFTVCSATGIQVTLTMQVVPPTQSGGAIGYNMLVTNIGGAVAPPAFGLLVDSEAGYGAAWIAAAAGLAVAAALLIPRRSS